MKIQKRLAGQLLKSSTKRIKFDKDRLADIKEAITKTDIRQLIDEKAIKKIDEKGVSRSRANKIKSQKSKGKQKGPGSRKGKRTARLPRKEEWMIKIRSQRELIKELKDNSVITQETYRMVYKKCKGGFFRNKRHIKLFLGDHNLFQKAEPGVKRIVKTKKKTVKVTKKAPAKKQEAEKKD
ncbi:50S ribosomal protein L19e [Candidatus Woesearchaeota archaeon]|nr:50S ribosomal protein L19e [Candidatus Woesearchaeota archaeon]MCF7901355.1 50S ribosomal protein L19e [Candidatus Woesearchaeota archaeon]MCF8013355.1 50S ribosomal protein L19e [Candidatus Woesearchaeota archaeon]